jgi:hypothetical protein
MARALLCVLVVMLLGRPLQAAEARRPHQIPLTPQLVENFIASYEPVRAFNAQYDKRWGHENFADPAPDGPTRMRQSLEAHGALEAFNALVARYGFKGIEAWWPVAYSTMIAYGFSEPGHDPAKAEAEIRRALAALAQKRELSPEQKARSAALKQSLADYAAMAPPPGNVAVVTPYRAKLAALLREKPGESAR